MVTAAEDGIAEVLGRERYEQADDDARDKGQDKVDQEPSEVHPVVHVGRRRTSSQCRCLARNSLISRLRCEGRPSQSGITCWPRKW
jgi:hypothetical protein